MLRPRIGVIALSTTAAVALVLLWARPAVSGKLQPPRLTLTPAELPADGYAIAALRIETESPERPRIVFTNPHTASVERMVRTAGGWQATLRAGVWPARTAVRVAIHDSLPAVAELSTKLVAADSESDGTPDFLRLNDPRDQAAFRRWFPFLAEVQYFQETKLRPKEIVDCAALIRYAYREALRSHTGGWASEAHLPLVPAFDSVARYEYPFTPLGSALFRVRDGAFRASDLDDGTFAQFADAQTMQRLNTHLVSHDVGRALPGDLLFFRQDGGDLPFHSMVYVGESAITKDGARYVVYHTGPQGADPGEIRRLSLPELLRFPEPQWRPIASNRNFLGVYRWNILGEDK